MTSRSGAQLICDSRQTTAQQREVTAATATMAVTVASGSPASSEHFGRQVISSFIRFPSLAYYVLLVFLCGLLTAFHWSFFFWFLESIRPKDTLLMGTSAVSLLL